jgi:hypothetical protein
MLKHFKLEFGCVSLRAELARTHTRTHANTHTQIYRGTHTDTHTTRSDGDALDCERAHTHNM